MLTVRLHPLLHLQMALDFQQLWEMLRGPLPAMLSSAHRNTVFHREVDE
jgi:hypothetical protein